MPLFTIDLEKCQREGACVAECPARIIELTGKNGTPEPVEGAGALCINCGHCMAVCPHGALSLATMPVAESQPVRRELLPSGEAMEHALRARRSIRTYRDKPVDRDTLENLIETARYAPSGHNCQPVSWLVIHDTKEARRLAGMVIDWMRHTIETQPELAGAFRMDRVVAGWEGGEDPVLRGAPHVIVTHAPKSMLPAPAACTIALNCLELAVFSRGLGACWAGYFNTAATQWGPMKEALGLPDDHAPFGSMMIGHPRYDYHRLPKRKPAKILWR